MQAKRAYYSPTAFVDMLFKENPSLENNIPDIYAYFKPQDAYVDKYQQVCARIIGIIFKRKEKTFNNKPIINPKTGKPINPRTPQQQKEHELQLEREIQKSRKVICIPNKKVIEISNNNQPIIHYKISKTKSFNKDSKNLMYISIITTMETYTGDGGEISYYPSAVFTNTNEQLEKMIRDNEIVIKRVKHASEMKADFNDIDYVEDELWM